MEACGTAHHWAREIQALGHEVRLMPAQYVKQNKTDAADAMAICEAVQRPTMRFVGNRPHSSLDWNTLDQAYCNHLQRITQAAA